jgi:hypothetical protein
LRRIILKKSKIPKYSKANIITRIVLTAVVIGILIRSALLGAFESCFICLLVLLLFALPSFIERTLKIDLPDTLEIIILVFIFAAEILGELSSYYLQYPHWDTILHSTWGFLCAAVGFSLVDILNRNAKIKFTLSPVFLSISAFCFSMTVGVFWEFFEFGADMILGLDMQKDTVTNIINSTLLDPTKTNTVISVENISEVLINGQNLGVGGYLDIGLIDTMEDLAVNFIGAILFSFIGYFYIKRRGKGKLARQFIPTLTSEKDDENEKQDK